MKLRYLLAAAYLLGSFVFAGTMDYKQQVAAAAEKKSPEPARIWSQKCAKQGKQIYASKSDNGPLVIKCADARVRT